MDLACGIKQDCLAKQQPRMVLQDKQKLMGLEATGT